MSTKMLLAYTGKQKHTLVPYILGERSTIGWQNLYSNTYATFIAFSNTKPCNGVKIKYSDCSFRMMF